MEDDTNMFYELFLGTTVWMRNTNGFKYDLTRLGYAMMLTFRLIDYTYLEMIKAPSDRSVYMKYIDALGKIASAENQKVILMPLEASNVLGSIAGIAELAKAAFEKGNKNG